MTATWSGRVALITGSTAGLGWELARAWRNAGAQVVLVGRDRARLDAAVTRLAASARVAEGEDVLPVVADVTRDDDVAAMIAAVQRRFGRLDVLVNNVGRSTRGTVLETTPEQFAELLAVNFLTTVRCTRAAMPLLRESRGHVVNIGSLAGKSAARFLGAYPPSKFAVAAYSQQLRLELEGEGAGVQVLLVCPGPIRRDDAGERYGAESAGLPENARRPGGGVKLSEIDPAWLAGRIVRACERRERELVVPWKARVLFAIGQMWPGVGDWLVKKMTSGGGEVSREDAKSRRRGEEEGEGEQGGA